MAVPLPFGDGGRFERITHLSMVIPSRSSFGPFPAAGVCSRTHERIGNATIERRLRCHVFILTADQMNASRRRYDPHLLAVTTNPTHARPSSGSSPIAPADLARSHGDYLHTPNGSGGGAGMRWPICMAIATNGHAGHLIVAGSGIFSSDRTIPGGVNRAHSSGEEFDLSHPIVDCQTRSREMWLTDLGSPHRSTAGEHRPCQDSAVSDRSV
jgi:hypothetical protein